MTNTHVTVERFPRKCQLRDVQTGEKKSNLKKRNFKVLQVNNKCLCENSTG